MENYWLEPAALHREIHTIRAGERNLPSVAEIEARLLQFCVDVLPLVAANWLCAERNMQKLFDKGAPIMKRQKIIDVLKGPKKLNSVEAEADKLLAAKEALIIPLLNSLETAHTRIEGKMLFHQAHQSFAPKIPPDIFRNYLARAICDTDVPANIRRIVEDHILKFP